MWQQTELFQPCVALLAQHVPALVVAIAVRGDVFFAGVQRPVRRCERNVAIKWSAAGNGFIDEPARALRGGVGVVIVFREFVNERILIHQARRLEVATGTAQGSIVPLKPALGRQRMVVVAGGLPLVWQMHGIIAADVPLAATPGCITSIVKNFGRVAASVRSQPW